MMKKAFLLVVAAMIATPVAADVKAGVDAWSRGDYRAAIEEWRGPAASGDADAQFNMGQAYKLGRGVPADMAAAIEWFRKAAAQGHEQAIDNYSLALFQDGRKDDALPWLEKAVARDEKRTELVLGTMLFNGDSVLKDWVRAYALVTRSSQQNLPQASKTLAQMDQYIPEAQRQQGIAMARDIERKARASTVVAPPNSAAGRLASATPAIAPKMPPAPKPAATKSAENKPPKAKPQVVASAPKAPKPATAGKAPAASGGGNWKIQLGAFRDDGNARALWAKVGSKTGGAASYVKSGEVTRLQATGFGSKSAAQAACAKSGVSCVVVGQ